MAASIAFQATNTSNATSNSYTLAFTVASAAGQERLVGLSGIQANIPSVPTYTAVTVDGQTATLVGSYARSNDGSNVGPMVSFWRAPGTSGTSINVVVTLSHGAYSCCGAVWTLTDADTLLASTSLGVDNPGATLTLSANTATGGVAAAMTLAYDASTRAQTWSGLTERFDGIGAYSTDWISGADLNVVSGSTPLAIVATLPTFGGTNAISGVAVSFNPLAGGTTLTAAAGSYAVTGSAVTEHLMMPLGAAGE